VLTVALARCIDAVPYLVNGGACWDLSNILNYNVPNKAETFSDLNSTLLRFL
jgi:hypothetical protein